MQSLNQKFTEFNFFLSIHSMHQLTHNNQQFSKQQFPITLVCDGLSNAANIGSLFRIADAFNIKEIIFCGKNISFGKRMTKTSRSTENYVCHRIEHEIEDVLFQLKQTKNTIIALEITDKSIPISSYQLHTNQSIAVIIGHENFGISETILQHADAIVHINMFGNNSSMNVVQATSILIYELTNQLQKF